jgi:proteasome accessory factor C
MSKTSPTQTAARLLDLVPYIYSHQGISIPELAQQFGISDSELLANLNSLWMCGESRFDLVELDFESGYVHIRNADALNIVRSLSTQEIIAILFGLDLLRDQILEERADLSIQIDDVRKMLGDSLEPLVAASQSINGVLLQEIDAAIKRRSKIQITYHSISDDIQSDRIVHPIERSFSKGHDFLRGYCENADAIRIFRIDRILSASQVNQSAPATASVSSKSPKIDIRVKIHKNLRGAFEILGPCSPIGEDQYSLSIFNPSWVIREVIASGGSIEVLEPPELRQEIARQIQSIAKQYR